MTNATVTTLNALMKEQWPDERCEAALFEDCPLLGMLEKREDFGGRYHLQPVIYSGQQGRSADFTYAQTNRSATSSVDFTVYRKKDYAVGGISTEALLAANGNSDYGVVDALETEMDTCITALKRSMSAGVWGNHGGAIGQILSISSTVVTLTNYEDAIYFEVGQKICASNADGTSGSLLDSGDFVTVTKVNRNNGEITADANWSNIATIAAGDYLFVQGDFGGKMNGVKAWIPPGTISGTDSFLGVNRSTDEVRLGGCRYTGGSGGRISEILTRGLSRAWVQGASPKTMFLNPSDYQNLIIDIQATASHACTAQAKSTDRKVDIFYSGVVLNGPYGRVECYGDPSCPVGYAWALDLKKMYLKSLGKAPHLLDHDGNKFRYEASADEMQWRYGMYGNLVVTKPSAHLVVTL